MILQNLWKTTLRGLWCICVSMISREQLKLVFPWPWLWQLTNFSFSFLSFSLMSVLWTKRWEIFSMKRLIAALHIGACKCQHFFSGALRSILRVAGSKFIHWDIVLRALNLSTSGDSEHLPWGSWWEQRISKKPPPKQQEGEGVQHLFCHQQHIALKCTFQWISGFLFPAKI